MVGGWGWGVGGYPCVWRGLTTLTEEPRRRPFLTHRSKIADGYMEGEIRRIWMVSTAKRKFRRWEKIYTSSLVSLSHSFSIKIYFLLLFLSFSDYLSTRVERRKRNIEKRVWGGGGGGEELIAHSTTQAKHHFYWSCKQNWFCCDFKHYHSNCLYKPYIHTNTHNHTVTHTHTTQYYI